MDSIRYPYAMVGKLMNRERAKELWPIIKAFGDGKAIQYKTEHGDLWDTSSRPSDLLSFNQSGEYRIKPEPREWTAVYDHKLGELTNSTPVHGDARYEVIKVREVLE